MLIYICIDNSLFYEDCKNHLEWSNYRVNGGIYFAKTVFIFSTKTKTLATLLIYLFLYLLLCIFMLFAI